MSSIHRITQTLLLFVAALAFGIAPALAQEHGETPHAGAPTHVTDLRHAAADTHGAAAEHGAAGAHGGEESHGLPEAAPVVADLGFFKVTNSMVVTWIVAIALIAFAQYATRRIKDVPDGAQNFWEWMVESLHDFLAGIIGHDLVKKTFWFFATAFIFILFTNWAGLIPGVGSIGWGHPNEAGAMTHISRPLFRGANADLNLTAAIAIVFFLSWIVWALRANGVGGFVMHIFGPRGNAAGFMKIILIAVFLLVGLLEVISILFRPVSLSFRLFGNIFAGENLLEAMANLGGWGFGWLLPVPFYFMELLVGFVQALVFTLLTAVFTLLIMPHDDAHH